MFSSVHSMNSFGSFPKSKIFGLIEAGDHLASCDKVTSFPKSKIFGLIEAKMGQGSMRSRRNFPKSKIFGLIEASSPPPGWLFDPFFFPKSKIFGLIEAIGRGFGLWRRAHLSEE